MAATRLLVGCSGWVYKDWRGRFYPDGLAAKRWLPFYARHFPTVEINGSFYRLPAPETFAAWRDAVPPGFVFAVKASRYLTHLKHLADPEAPIERLFASVSQLGPRLGPVLYQLPPRWVPSPERFAHFLAALPKTVNRRRVEHVVEFRDPRGYTDEMLALLRAHGVGLCLHDMPGSAPPREVTAGVARPLPRRRRQVRRLVSRRAPRALGGVAAGAARRRHTRIRLLHQRHGRRRARERAYPRGHAAGDVIPRRLRARHRSRSSASCPSLGSRPLSPESLAPARRGRQPFLAIR